MVRASFVDLTRRYSQGWQKGMRAAAGARARKAFRVDEDERVSGTGQDRDGSRLSDMETRHASSRQEAFEQPMSSQPVAQQPGGFPRSFHVVAKPVGARCNLECTYCYYLHKDDMLPGTTASRMADDVLEEFIRQYIAGQEIDEVVFNWHGGEPALAGLDFYRKVVAVQRKFAGTLRVRNDFQTNGVLLDEAWCEFFRDNGFYVGLSIDGPRELHDRYRVGKGGLPSFEQVHRAARLLRQYQVPFNAMAVIHAGNARHP